MNGGARMTSPSVLHQVQKFLGVPWVRKIHRAKYGSRRLCLHFVTPCAFLNPYDPAPFLFTSPIDYFYHRGLPLFSIPLPPTEEGRVPAYCPFGCLTTLSPDSYAEQRPL